MVDAVYFAVNHAVRATGRCLGPEEGLKLKVLPFLDPEEW
jgi:hypothetical protein